MKNREVIELTYARKGDSFAKKRRINAIVRGLVSQWFEGLRLWRMIIETGSNCAYFPEEDGGN